MESITDRLRRRSVALTLVIAGCLGGTLIDLDHIPLILAEDGLRGRPAHIPLFVLGHVFLGLGYTRIRRLRRIQSVDTIRIGLILGLLCSIVFAYLDVYGLSWVANQGPTFHWWIFEWKDQAFLWSVTLFGWWLIGIPLILWKEAGRRIALGFLIVSWLFLPFEPAVRMSMEQHAIIGPSEIWHHVYDMAGVAVKGWMIVALTIWIGPALAVILSGGLRPRRSRGHSPSRCRREAAS